MFFFLCSILLILASFDIFPLLCLFSSEVYRSCEITLSRGLSKGFDSAGLFLVRLLTRLAFVLRICRGSPTVPRGGTLLSAVVPHQPLFSNHLSYLVLFLLYVLMFLLFLFLFAFRVSTCTVSLFLSRIARKERGVSSLSALALALCLSRR